MVSVVRPSRYMSRPQLLLFEQHASPVLSHVFDLAFSNPAGNEIWPGLVFISGVLAFLKHFFHISTYAIYVTYSLSGPYPATLSSTISCLLWSL